MKQGRKNTSKRNNKECICIKQTDDEIRKNVKKSIKECLKEFDPDKLKIKDIATKFEAGLTKKYKKISRNYTSKARTILLTLRRSDEFKRKVLSNEIKPERLAFISSKILLDSKLAKKREEMENDIVESKRSDYLMAITKIEDSMYTCAKCKGKRTTFYEQQVRSADEPMTVFVHCLDCDHKMKF